MITLHTYAAGWNAESVSPFCVKAIFLLNVSGLPWTRKDQQDPRPFPQSKLPAIEVDGKIIGDSDEIFLYLKNNGADIDAHLSQREAATAHAFRRMAEEHLYYQLVLDRWANDKIWPLLRDTYFRAMPQPMRAIIPGLLRRSVIKGLLYLGHLRQSEDMRTRRIEQDFAAISAQLDGQAFLVGEKPCSADASLGAMLQAISNSPIETALSKRVSEDETLSAYVERVVSAMQPTAAAA